MTITAINGFYIATQRKMHGTGGWVKSGDTFLGALNGLCTLIREELGSDTLHSTT